MAYLPRVLDALVAAKNADTELIVVDGGSSDGSREFSERHVAVDRVLECPGGPPGAVRNVGARAAGGSYLCFLDADCLISPGYLESVRACIAANLPCFGSKYELPPNPRWIEWAWNSIHSRVKDGPVGYLNGGNLVIRREAFDAVGGFSEKLVSGEDHELCQRLARVGYGTTSVSSVSVAHLGNPKSLRAFFRQQVWHALGTFGQGMSPLLRDVPFAASLLHLVMHVAAVVLVLTSGGSPMSAILATALVFSVAAVASAVRVSRSGRFAALLPGVLLYYLYLTARVFALVLFVSSQLGVSEWKWSNRSRS